MDGIGQLAPDTVATNPSAAQAAGTNLGYSGQPVNRFQQMLGPPIRQGGVMPPSPVAGGNAGAQTAADQMAAGASGGGGGQWVDAGYGQGPLNPQGFQWSTGQIMGRPPTPTMPPVSVNPPKIEPQPMPPVPVAPRPPSPAPVVGQAKAFGQGGPLGVPGRTGGPLPPVQFGGGLNRRFPGGPAGPPTRIY